MTSGVQIAWRTVRPTRADSVLQKLSALIRYGLEKAAQAGNRAAESKNPTERRDFHNVEESWSALAGPQDRLASPQTAGQMLRQSTEAAVHRDKRDNSATIPCKQLIAIVEDDAGVRKSLGRLVVLLGHASRTFVTAEEYLESELLGETACLICDVQLPGMSGPDLQARLIGDGHRIPILFMTGNFNEITRARVLTAGAVGYLAKPVDAGTLIGCLEKALASTPT